MVLSSSEAEYVASSATALETIWIKELAKTLGIDVNEDMMLRGESQTSLQMEREARLAKAAKHIKSYYHFIFSTIEQCFISVQYVPREHSQADVITKVLGQGPHLKLTIETGINMRSTEDGVQLLRRSHRLW